MWIWQLKRNEVYKSLNTKKELIAAEILKKEDTGAKKNS
jgi:hypothetical protein